MSEHDLQVSYFQWVDWMANQEPLYRLIYAVPNGGLRNVVTAVKMKAEGLKRGVPDVCIPIPTSFNCGAYIEFKSKRGTLSDHQKWRIEQLKNVGHIILITKELEAAKEFTTTHINEHKRMMKNENLETISTFNDILPEHVKRSIAEDTDVG